MVISFARSKFPLLKWWLCLGLILLGCPSMSKAQVCGDVNHDGNVNVGDVVAIIDIVFRYHPMPGPIESGDVNHDGWVNVGDAVYLIAYVFRGGPPPNCPSFTGTITDSGCKFSSRAVWAEQECVQWEYDGNGVLSLHRTDMTLNCCPGAILVGLEFSSDSLIITEYESYDPFGPCDCTCLFDLDYYIVSLPPGEYTVVFPGQYVTGDNKPVSFHIVIGDEPSQGEACQSRIGYPWNYW